MKESIARLLDHYATVTDGSSVLLRPDLIGLCKQHAASEPQFCDAFAHEILRRYAVGDLDADGAAFAVNDLHEAANFILPPFARRTFDLLEYRESSPTEALQLLEIYGHGTAA